MTQGPLRRARGERWIAGVCGGLAVWTGMSPGAVRALYIVLSIFPGSLLGGLVVYVVLWIVIPEETAGAPPTQAAPLPRPPSPP